MTLVYQSTRDENNTVTASQAILQGLATDGGLFTPVSYPQVELDFNTLKDASYQEVAKLVLSAFWTTLQQKSWTTVFLMLMTASLIPQLLLRLSNSMGNTIWNSSTVQPLPLKIWLCRSCLTL